MKSTTVIVHTLTLRLCVTGALKNRFTQTCFRQPCEPRHHFLANHKHLTGIQTAFPVDVSRTVSAFSFITSCF